ncbi:zinc uptake regulator, Fur family [Alteribacillus persepolensis]|uniref:Zinc uptake regulator, Fur family n=1 Tax=Alteribacillus persepolensis TaxID=568899 RepID=A0A1G8CTW8_9BACI|nr:transcriptional repressor [Alteribacillus persepolensis]SDH48921.1 zinc uptake regulator, Fur family [Alteribacillus persepolensis]
MNVKQALDKLKKEGFKFTGKREQLLRLFAEEKRYLSAKEVLASMQKLYPNVSFDTVYRNLSLFEEMDILEMTELEGEKRFRFSCSTTKHHHHLICLDCGKTRQIETCPMEWLEERMESDFEVTGHKFEIYGHCYDCQMLSV